MSQVCANAKKYQDLPLPVIVSEWSLMTGILDREFMSSFYQAQATAWDWSAGSIFCESSHIA